MKRLLLLMAVNAVCAARILQDPVNLYKEGDRFFYFPGDGDGRLHLVDSQEPVDTELIARYTRNCCGNEYLLFTRSNPLTPQFLQIFEESSILQSNIDFNKVTVFLAHGWRGDAQNEMNLLLTRAFLQDNDVNVIVLNWGVLANKGYPTAKSGTSEVGKSLGQFIQWLEALGMSYERTHLVGFSLGSHLVGSAGRDTDSRVKRITALDPAGPLWGSDPNRLVETDAQYVEVIHTSTRILGYTEPCGHADFYPNGGNSMPGCWLSSCSHGRAYEYMASSVENNHLMANECETYREATGDRCTGDLYPMGNSDLNKSRQGIFRVNTASKYPY